MTKAELEEENEKLRERIEALEFELHMDNTVKMKTQFMLGGVALYFVIITAIQSIFTLLEKPSPFTGVFGWWTLAFAVLYLIGFLGQIGMLLNKNVGVKAELSKDTISINADVGKNG